MIDYIRSENPLFHIIDTYPWLGEIQHDFGDISLHIEGLEKHTGKKIYKQNVANNVLFDMRILDKYKEKFMRTIPIQLGQTIVQSFMYQLSPELVIGFIPGKSEFFDDPMVYPDFFSTNLKNSYDFIMDNLDLVLKNKKEEAAIGFAGLVGKK